MKNIKIVFHDQPECYFAGSTVRGEVIITVEKPEEYKKIVVGILGQADVHWSAGSHGEDEQSFHNKVTYIKQSSVVWDKEDSPLPIGDQHYPFEYQLPENAAPSFQNKSRSQIGTVRYEIKAEVFFVGLLRYSLKALAPIQVGDNSDYLSMCEPTTVDMTKKVGFLCFNFGTITVTCNLPYTGFSPGDSIPISLHIENQSTKAVHIRFSLRSVHLYTSSGGIKYPVTHHKSILMSPEFHAGAITSFDGSLKIANEVDTTYRGCSCISVEYAVTLKAIAALGSSVDMNIPIVVANTAAMADPGFDMGGFKR